MGRGEDLCERRAGRPDGPTLPPDGRRAAGGRLRGAFDLQEVRVPGDPTRTSTVRVRFSELQVAKLHDKSVEEKRLLGISKGAGVSIVRANREIDYGWYFMGNKRKENYDDWWRCEIMFDPPLDELFGVTHSKQEIHPKDDLFAILVPDLEATAHTLNSRVRAAFTLERTREETRPTTAARRGDGDGTGSSTSAVQRPLPFDQRLSPLR